MADVVATVALALLVLHGDVLAFCWMRFGVRFAEPAENCGHYDDRRIELVVTSWNN
jgi:hypothetical protein